MSELSQPAVKATAPRLLRKINTRALMIEGRALLALLLIVVVFSLLSPNFLSTDNLIVMTRHVAMNAILAIGMLLVILNGGIDLSVGSIVGLSGVVAGLLIEGLEINGLDLFLYPAAWVVIVVSLGVGTLAGWVNGVVVARLNVAPFIATLGMLYVARGIALLITNGTPFSKLGGEATLGNTGFLTFLKSAPLGLPMPVWAMVLFAAVFAVVLSKSPFGRWLYATGGNERAAELSGVPVKKVKTRIYVLSGLCAAAVGLLLTADLSSATPAAGEFFELNAIAAVVIGGAALSGGRGTIRGTLIGAFVIGFLVDGLVLVGVSQFWQQIIKGAVIIIAVALDQLQQTLQKRRSAKAALTPPKPSEHVPASV
ncbi:ABC transporter permease [Nonomuraea basaltis]|uniref:ABC transporter permease n=1 Tax=Nonomuraea basaltis TaxID=2495887 RepID=UPI001F0EB08E|nr:ABC transporter permease [Nonomuraea basaltis]